MEHCAKGDAAMAAVIYRYEVILNGRDPRRELAGDVTCPVKVIVSWKGTQHEPLERLAEDRDCPLCHLGDRWWSMGRRHRLLQRADAAQNLPRFPINTA